MDIKEIEELEQWFDKYSESDYVSYFSPNEPVRGNYTHKWECFSIVIFKNNEVYQTNSDHETQGIELKTMDEMKVRFESFVGEPIEKLSDDE